MKLQLKRSSIYTGTTSPAAYVPTAPTSAQTLFGELCVNYNDGDPALFVKTEADTIVRVDGNEKHYNLSTATNADGAQIDLLHKSTGINIQTTESTINFTGSTGVTVSQTSTGTIDIAISGASDIGVDLGVTRAAANNVITNTAGNNATLTGASGSEAGLLLPADKTKLDNLPTLGSGDYDDRYVQVTGDSMTGGLTIDPTTDDADALITGAGHDIKLGAGANIVFDNTQDTTIQPNSSAAAAVNVTLPVSSGTVTIEPTSNGSYLRKFDSGTVSWVLISDDTDGAVTSITGGDGIDVTAGGTSNPTISVDPHLGIEVSSDGVSTKMHTGGGLVNNLGANSDELGIQNGGDSNQILVWKGANRVNAVNIPVAPNNASTQPEGLYTNVATTQDVVTDPAATGLTVSFTVAADNTVASATVVNPGQGYTDGEILSVVDHGNLKVVVDGITANAEWVVENYTGGSGGGGGDLTGITEGDGIVITNDAGPNPTIAVDLVANQGLEFDSSTPGNLQIISGNNPQDTLLWTANGGARTIVNGGNGASGASTEDPGDYVNVATSNGTGSGCRVNFTVAVSTGVISSLVIANPGSGYTAGDTLTIDGHQTSAPADITFTLETAANDGVWDYTGWRTGAITVGSAGGGGGDISGIDAGPGITIDETDTTTPKISFDPATDGGLEYTGSGDSQQVRVNLSASSIQGTVAIEHGGTGLSTTPIPNGQLLIGNGTGYTLANLTAGTNIVISSPSNGNITIATGLTTAQGSGVFQLNEQTVTADYTIPNGYNAVSAGPITINDGVTVTVDDGEHWSIV